ncbi:FAD dependent oxidoreductase [Violaceomyces palustris]|uniref:FAD dependent oxidoreductase n=1 Tax=Violaceomyces palustris TaxID=1673888 RepID=A0ACD0P0Q7_9BASI|nr:FAD dependent oxidoreductase [Violaceomyces palustris]
MTTRVSKVRPGIDPPGLPRPDPCLSYWLAHSQDSPYTDGFCSTELLPQQSDIVIVGSGMSGVLTAYFLMKELTEEGRGGGRSASLTMIEARDFCSGATGRNGGHCRPDSYLGFPTYSKHFGEDQAKKILKNEIQTLELVERLVRETGAPSEVDFWKGRGMDVFMDEKVKREAKNALDSYLASGGQDFGVEWVEDGKEAERRSRVKGALGAALYPAGSFYPHRFCMHILSILLSSSSSQHHRGGGFSFNIQTQTPVTSLSSSLDGRGQRRFKLKTTRGEIEAGTVIHATNAFVGNLVPELIHAVVPMRGHCSAHTPPRSFSGARMLETTQILRWAPGHECGVPQDPRAIQFDEAFDYVIQRKGTGSVIIGGGGGGATYRNPSAFGNTDDSSRDAGVSDYLVNCMKSTYEGWNVEAGVNDERRKGLAGQLGQGVERVWTGVMGFSKDELPYVGDLPGKPDEYVNAGHHGHGMARIATCSRGLARMRLAYDSPEFYESLTGLPASFRPTRKRLEEKAWGFEPFPSSFTSSSPQPDSKL